MTGPETLALESIAKRFGTTDALTDASLTIRPGSIHALLGENGAGKTTLMRIAYGLVQPDRGTIRDSSGNPIRLSTPAAAIRARIGMVHQHFTIVHAMTVAENVALGGRGRFDRRAAGARVHEIAATLGVTIDPDTIAGTLTVPAQQQLEIIKALSRDARLLILDEPTAVLAPGEAERLLEQLRRLASGGLGIVLITHRLREALALADDVTVLRRGATVLAAPASMITEPALAAAMLGEAPETVSSRGITVEIAVSGGTAAGAVAPVHAPSEAAARGDPVVRARKLTALDSRGITRVRGVDLDLYPGEVIGVAGVEGSGIRELLRALAGKAPIASGSLEGPATVGFIPEDRHREALTLEFSLVENIALRGAGARRGLTPWRRIRDRTRGMLTAFDVRAPGPDAAVRVLSGGNQQKLVLARELEGLPRLLVAENPTRGLDLRAAAAIRARLQSARGAGMAIIMYSSDLDELLLVADRMFAMFDGALVPVARDRQAVGRAMLGAT